MKVTYLHQYFNTLDMPGGTRSFEMGRRLVELGHEVNVVTTLREPDSSSGWRVTNEAGMTIHWAPIRYSNRMTYPRRLVSFMRFAMAASRRAAQLDADVILATSTPLTIAIPGAWASKWQGAPMVFEVRDLWPEVSMAMGVLRSRVAIGLARHLERFAYRRSQRVVALAPGMQDGVCATGYPDLQTAVIPNGSDNSLFGRGDAQAIHESFEWTRNAILLVYSGALGIANGVEYIVDLADEIRRLEPSSPIRFAILGDGASADAVRERALDRGLLDQTVFMLGRVAKRDVPNWLAASTATLMTYDGPEVVYRDSVSNKFFDSMAAGRPILANFGGFSVSVATSRGAGKQISRDVRLAAPEVLNCVNRRDWINVASERAREVSRDLFDRDVLARDLESVLIDAAERRPANSPIVGQRFVDLWSEVQG